MICHPSATPICNTYSGLKISNLTIYGLQVADPIQKITLGEGKGELCTFSLQSEA